MPKGRGNSPNTTEKVEKAILYVKAIHNDYSGARVRNNLIRNRYALGLARDHIPQKRAIEICISRNTNEIELIKSRIKDASLDKPWSIACCSEYSSFFPPGSIPLLMDIKQWMHRRSRVSKEAEEQYNEYSNLLGFSVSDITIRQAIWIVRLEPLVNNVFADEIARDEDMRFEYPLIVSMFYEIAEIACEILNEPFTSIGLDWALAVGDLDALAKIGALGINAASKPANCNHECESCEYMIIPGFIKLCMPRPKKEVDK